MEEKPYHHLNRTKSGFYRVVDPTPKYEGDSVLPTKRHNSPIAVVVCWNCKGNRRPLTRLRDENGKKTPDYRCDICAMTGIGRPAIPNQSQVHYQYRKEEVAA